MYNGRRSNDAVGRGDVMVISESLVALNLKSKDKLDIIKELGHLAYSSGKIKSIDKYIDSVLKREEEFSTAIGYSIAIPHGKSDQVVEPFIVFGRVSEQVEWDKDDDKEVKLIFLIGVPLAQSGDVHLKILANISRELMDEEFRKELMDAPGVREVCSTLKAIAL